MAEKRLPFDTVFIINRFLARGVARGDRQPAASRTSSSATACWRCSASTRPATACRQAIDAAAKIAANVEQLNRDLARDLPEPIRFGIGVNGGEVIIGDIGFASSGVHGAGRPRQRRGAAAGHDRKSRVRGGHLRGNLRRPGVCRPELPQTEVDIRGRVEPMTVRTAERAAMLSDVIATGAAPSAAMATATV